MKKITVSSVRNKDIYHEIALILDAMSAMNMVTLSWIVHTWYPLQEPQQFIMNLSEVTKSDQVQDSTMKKETGEANLDHDLIFENIAA